jgi:dephospho-CoA kinase
MGKQIIALVGEPLAGKGTFCDVFKSYYYMTAHISTGDIVREILAILNKPKDRINSDTLVMALSGAFGSDFLARAVEHRIHEDLSPRIIFDCMRMPEDEAMVKRLPYSVHTVYITASPEVRYKRLQQRRRDGEHGISFEKFMAHEKLPTLKIAREIGLRANTILENNGKAEDFETAILKFCRSLP